MRRLTLLLLSLALAGCGSDSSTGPTLASLAGTWKLSTVDGHALPFIVQDFNAVTVEITNETIDVRADGTFTDTGATLTTGNGQTNVTVVQHLGTISLSGNLVTLAFNGSGSLTGPLTGNTSFSLTNKFIYVYVKQ